MQAEAAMILGISQPKVSAPIRYKLEGFSVERLMLFLTSLQSALLRFRHGSHSMPRRGIVGP